jgi:hypothetical protein
MDLHRMLINPHPPHPPPPSGKPEVSAGLEPEVVKPPPETSAVFSAPVCLAIDPFPELPWAKEG